MNRHQTLKAFIGGMALLRIPTITLPQEHWPAPFGAPDLIIDGRKQVVEESQVWGEWLIKHQQRDRFRKPYLLEIWHMGLGHLVRFTSMHRIEVDGVIGTHVVPGTFQLARQTWWKWLPGPLPV